MGLAGLPDEVHDHRSQPNDAAAYPDCSPGGREVAIGVPHRSESPEWDSRLSKDTPREERCADGDGSTNE